MSIPTMIPKTMTVSFADTIAPRTCDGLISAMYVGAPCIMNPTPDPYRSRPQSSVIKPKPKLNGPSSPPKLLVVDNTVPDMTFNMAPTMYNVAAMRISFRRPIDSARYTNTICDPINAPNANAETNSP